MGMREYIFDIATKDKVSDILCFEEKTLFMPNELNI